MTAEPEATVDGALCEVVRAELERGRCTPGSLAAKLDRSRTEIEAALSLLEDRDAVDRIGERLYEPTASREEPELVDFAGVWHEFVRADDDHRGDAAVDLAFWEGYASEYDDNVGSCATSLEAVIDVLETDDSVLDVGAGTGRFTLPIAERVHRVTALDHSSAMLRALREKTAQSSIETVRTVEAAWEDATVEPHDVVIAAWSLYRLPDLAAGLQKLVDHAERALVIVDSAGERPPHERAIDEVWNRERREKVPRALYYAGALWQLGVRADVRVVRERTRFGAESPEAIAREHAPHDATARQIKTLAQRLDPWITTDAESASYAYDSPVGVVTWTRPDPEKGFRVA
ncbi:class I SAM-dependent methyltransferase [Haloferacaceae archaeon DSL9]